MVAHCGVAMEDLERIERAVRLPRAPDEVWPLVAEPEQLGAWLGGEVDVELRPGARGAFRPPEGATRRIMVLAVEPGRELSFRWWPEADVGAATTVTISVDDFDDG